jgi:maltose O-acetyltransferase
LVLYYALLSHFPHSSTPLVGRFCEWLRYQCCKRIFKKCGKGVNIEQGARFGKGFGVEIGHKSGIGMNCKVPDKIIIGENVMMGPEVVIYGANHEFKDTSIPMIKQGMSIFQTPVIEDDVWLGQRVMIMSGKTIKKGTIVAANAIVTKDFPEFSIIGGNPAKIIKSRLDIEKK